MKKIINDPVCVVDEALAGIVKAYPGHIRQSDRSGRVVVRADAPVRGKVAICTGGGAGHLPMFLGYVGPGLADAASVGNVFSSPGAEDMLIATTEADGGAGALFLFGNYGGDVMNFEMAAELAEMQGIPVQLCRANDDIASAPAEEKERRRGIAGIFFPYKIAGAKAATMANLDEVKAVTDRAIDSTRSMGFALSSCTIPAAAKPTFTIADDEMEIGMGIHGEPGISRTKIKQADEIAKILSEAVIADLPFTRNDEVAVLVNGLGATPPEELFILYSRVHDLLNDHGLSIYKTFVGEYGTSMEMAGASISLLLLDSELKYLLDAPAHSPFLPQWRSL